MSGTALEDILSFVDLAKRRRTSSLPQEERQRMDALDEQLRDLIDGARPAPKRLDNPAPTKSRPKINVPKAKIKVDSSSGKSGISIGGLAESLEISLKDKKKLKQVSVEDLPVSDYTPSRSPAYLDDYYGEDFARPSQVVAKIQPSQVVNAEGLSVDLPHETRDLWGLVQVATKSAAGPRETLEVDAVVRPSSSVADQPAPPMRPASSVADRPAPPASSVTDRPAPTPIPQAPNPIKNAGNSNGGMPAIVHLMAGGTRRGHIDSFAPPSGMVKVRSHKDPQKAPETIRLEEVLAIFFGTEKGQPPSAGDGQTVVVKLVNDRQVTGQSSDYQEGASALTVIPAQRRGGIDRIWIPAWAVKEIEI